jgi:predicted deacylase
VRHAYEGVKNLLRRYGQLGGEIVKIDQHRHKEPLLVSAPRLDSYVPCPQSGIWEPKAILGQTIRAGDLVGYLHDFSDHAADPLPIHSSRGGFLIMMHMSTEAKKGTTLYVVAEASESSLDSRK